MTPSRLLTSSRLRAGTLACALMATLPPAGAADFGLAFTWGKLPPCGNGKPAPVPSPTFALTGVPPGTHALVFTLADLNAMTFRHGGGAVAYHGQAHIPAGSFSYLQPCPPTGQHTYQWTVTARTSAGVFGRDLASATARAKYPQ